MKINVYVLHADKTWRNVVHKIFSIARARLSISFCYVSWNSIDSSVNSGWTPSFNSGPEVIKNMFNSTEHFNIYKHDQYNILEFKSNIKCSIKMSMKHVL